MDEIEVGPFELNRGGAHALRFAGRALRARSIVQVTGSSWDLPTACALAAFGLDPSLVGYPALLAARMGVVPYQPAWAVNVVSTSPRSEVSLFWPSVWEEVTLGQSARLDSEAGRLVRTALDLEPLLYRRPEELSGGETARIICASHLLAAPRVLILDRTFGEFDVSSRQGFANLIFAWPKPLSLVLVEGARYEMIDELWDTDFDPVLVTQSHKTTPMPAALSEDRLRSLQANRRFKEGGARLIVRELTVVRGGRTIIQDFGFDAPEGQVTWLLGPNGSGKTTFIESIAGLLPAARGEAVWLAASGVRVPAELHVAYAPQDPDRDITELTLLDEVLATRNVQGARFNREKAQTLLGNLGVPEEEHEANLTRDQSVRKQASVLARLASGREICLLDEPTLYLAGAQRGTVVRAMKNFLTTGGVIVCATHDEELCAAFE